WDIVIPAHERLAREPFVAVDRFPEGGGAGGRYFGNRGLLREFQAAADAAMRSLLQSPHKNVAEAIQLPSSPRCYSSSWMDFLYILAQQELSPLLQARERTISINQRPWWEKSADFVYVTFAFLERDVHFSSLVALDLLETSSPPTD